MPRSKEGADPTSRPPLRRALEPGGRLLFVGLLLSGLGAAPGPDGLRTREVSAQELWTESSTLGYSALGLGVAFATIWGGNCSNCDLGAGIGVIAGGLGFGIGHMVGSSAESAGRDGRRPSTAQLYAVRAGTVLAGASLGALVAGVYINRKGVKEPGEDRRDLIILSLIGAGVGAWVEHRQEGWLRRATENGMAIRLRPGAGGSWSVAIEARR